MSPITVQCNCGNIKLTLPPPASSLLCHCVPCRRFTGGTVATFVRTPVTDLEVTGTPKIWVIPADSGHVIERHFCGDCGCSMFNFNHGKPERYIVYAGVFPPGTVPPPDLEVYTRSAEKWEGTFEGCKAFEAGAQ